MVSQPVVLRVDSLHKYREFACQHHSEGHCFERQVVDAINRGGAGPRAIIGFCWMCQLGTYLKHHAKNDKQYAFVDTSRKDNDVLPMMRFGLHIMYEPPKMERAYNWRCQLATRGSLCSYFGSFFREYCTHPDTARDISVAQKFAFQYNMLKYDFPQHVKARVWDVHQKRIRNATNEVLKHMGCSTLPTA
jgi:hypothetical protein